MQQVKLIVDNALKEFDSFPDHVKEVMAVEMRTIKDLKKKTVLKSFFDRRATKKLMVKHGG